MKKIVVGTTSIYILPIPDAPKGMRREHESAAVRKIIREVMGREVELDHDCYGAPLLKGSEVFISISHSATVAAVAFDATRPVGIDIEQWRGQLVRVANRFLSPTERAYATDDESLLMAWTAKEATFKVAADPNLMMIDIVAELRTVPPQCSVADRKFIITYLREGDNLIALSSPE